MFDDLDLRLLRELQRDGRASHRSLASRLGTTTPTVGARLRRLQEAGVLQGVRAVVSSVAVAGTLWAVLATVPGARLADVLAALRTDADVEQAMALSGGRVLALVRPSTAQGLAAFERRLGAAGATAHESWAVTDVAVERGPDLARHAAVAACAQCRGPIHGEGESARVGSRRVWFCCAQCRSEFLARHDRLEAGARRS
jgi:DNA-binding Lrp family transcriptional regulator